MSATGSSSGEAWTPSRPSCAWTSSDHSVGGPRTGDTGGGSTASVASPSADWPACPSSHVAGTIGLPAVAIASAVTSGRKGLLGANTRDTDADVFAAGHQIRKPI